MYLFPSEINLISYRRMRFGNGSWYKAFKNPNSVAQFNCETRKSDGYHLLSQITQVQQVQLSSHCTREFWSKCSLSLSYLKITANNLDRVNRSPLLLGKTAAKINVKSPAREIQRSLYNQVFPVVCSENYTVSKLLYCKYIPLIYRCSCRSTHTRSRENMKVL